jgi:hypothetical protein
MALITDANKVEVISDLTISESSERTLNIITESDRSATITITTPSEATRERRAVRQFIEKRQALIVENGEDYSDDLAAVLDDLDGREIANAITYGTNKGAQRPQMITFRIDEEVATVLAHLLIRTPISISVADTIRKALTNATTKGF